MQTHSAKASTNRTMSLSIGKLIIAWALLLGFDTTYAASTCPDVMELGSLRDGIAARDSAGGQGYILWSRTNVHERFSPRPHLRNADHLIAVQFVDSKWQVDNNNTLSEFVIEQDDCIIAELDFSEDSVILLQGESFSVHGIDAGYDLGDLDITANIYDGMPNNGEFYATGSLIGDTQTCPQVMDLGNLKDGVAAIDESTGVGFLMWTAASTHDRFRPSPNRNNADHLIVVVFDGENWLFDNNKVYTPFTPNISDCLVAMLDFDSGTIELLNKQENQHQKIHGVSSGFSAGDLIVNIDRFGGVFNRGEYGISGSQIGNVSECPRQMSLDYNNSGVATRDSARGSGHIMWSEESIHQRFGFTPHQQNADHLIAVVFQNGWKFDNNSELEQFIPAASDCIVADIDFTNDSITSLKGQSGYRYGLEYGYAAGDLNITPNSFNGIANDGEFEVEGTLIGDEQERVSTCPDVMQLGSINRGVAARDNAKGSGYIMWSSNNLHQRFLPMPYTNNADHLIAVQFSSGQWMFDNNRTLTPFTPESTDCLIASVDFENDTASTLQGVKQVVNGIDSGYSLGDMGITANMFNGEVNRGEFDFVGTQLSVITPTIAVDDHYESRVDVAIDHGEDFGLLKGNGADSGTGVLLVASVQGVARYVGQSTETDSDGLNGIKGSVTVEADGSFIYRPPPGFVGRDTFSYVTRGEGGLSDTATVEINIRPIIIGQRGTCARFATPSLSPTGGIPENTIPAFEWAFQQGAEMIEVDIRPTLERRIVAFHDNFLRRTSNGIEGDRVDDLTIDELKMLDVGSWLDPAYAGLQVPTLEETAVIAKQYGATLWLDVKVVGIGAEVAQELANAGIGLDDMIINVGTDTSRDSIRQHLPNVPLFWKWIHSESGDGVNPPSNPDTSFFDTYIERGYSGLELWGKSGVTREFIKTAASVGLSVSLWGLVQPADILRAYDDGAYGVISCDVAAFP